MSGKRLTSSSTLPVRPRCTWMRNKSGRTAHPPPCARHPVAGIGPAAGRTYDRLPTPHRCLREHVCVNECKRDGLPVVRRNRRRHRSRRPDGGPPFFSLRKTLIDSAGRRFSARFPAAASSLGRPPPKRSPDPAQPAPSTLPARLPTQTGMAHRNISHSGGDFNTN